MQPNGKIYEHCATHKHIKLKIHSRFVIYCATYFSRVDWSGMFYIHSDLRTEFQTLIISSRNKINLPAIHALAIQSFAIAAWGPWHRDCDLSQSMISLCATDDV